MAETEQKKVVSRVKISKKVWTPVLAPSIFGQKVIGEAYLVKAQDAVGRTMSISLKEVTGNVKDQNALIHFRLSGVQNGKLQTELLAYQVTPASVRRMVKKNIERVDDYGTFATKDRQQVIVKPILITIRSVKHSIQTHLRAAMKEFLAAEIAKNDVPTLFQNIVQQKLQQALRKQLGKIYPLREVAIRVLQVTGASQDYEPLAESAAEQVEPESSASESVSEQSGEPSGAVEEQPAIQA